jgi:hypothetical protein
MADYFLLLDAAGFEGRLRPALAECRRRRSFGPFAATAAELAAAARAYAARYHTGHDEPLLARVGPELPFDTLLWRTLVGEVLLFAAAELPEFQTCPDTLGRLLAPGRPRPGDVPRERLAAVWQAHAGSRDLTFGGAAYRPESAGYNNAADVARLADDLATVRPEAWTPDALLDLPGISDEDLGDELEFAREWFPALADLYRRARDRGQVVVVESIY